MRRAAPLLALRSVPRQAGSSRLTPKKDGGELMGEMKRAIAREGDERRNQDRFASTLVIAASIIAAVRLARDDISRPSPRLLSTVSDSIELARIILGKVVH
jgi:hypothetical protein